MFVYISAALCIFASVWLVRAVLSLQRNIAIAKASEIPYTVSPLGGIAGSLWTALHDPFLTLLNAIPYSRDRQWAMVLEPHRGWNYAEQLREKFGEIFLIASPGQIYMNISNPGAIMQMTARRNDFLKPVEIYGIVDIFGTSMLSSEGATWKRQRKIVAPAFSEKSNALVWKESLKQATGMLESWSRLPGNSTGHMKVRDTAPHTALMTLHVISGAGFGVRQVWDGGDETQLGEKAIPGFNTTKLNENHNLTFKDSLNTLLHGIIWMAIFPVWFLRILPFDVNKKLMQSYYECGSYFKELSDFKVEQLRRGEKADEGTMDLMGPLIKASENEPEDGAAKDQYMTKQEVISNSWIFLFAGHETTGNTLHFAFLFLAISLEVQARLQQDVDAVVGCRHPDQWKYDGDMPRLYMSMAGATMNETLRLMPPIVDIPKIVKKEPQPLSVDGKTFTVPTDTIIHINSVGVHRNPQYWPHSRSKISTKSHDLDDFVPERWISTASKKPIEKTESTPGSDSEGSSNASDPRLMTTPATDNMLITPIKGAFIPFSEGARACPGRRFAQVEIIAVLAAVFQTYTIELDVSEWASDEEVDGMGNRDRRDLYEKAKAKARKLIRESESIITLQMLGTNVPVRFIRRGGERFGRCYN